MRPSNPPIQKTIGTACFKNQYLAVYLNEETKTIWAEYTGFIAGEDLREAFLICLNFMHKKQLKHWIADNKKMKAIKKQDQDWLINEFWPLLAKTHLERMVTINSEDIFNQMAMKNILAKAAPKFKFEHQNFTDEVAALKWLQQSNTEVVKAI